MDGIQDASSSTVNGNALPPFLSKIYDIVEDPATNPIVSWSKNNNSFIVWNVPEFSRILLPKYFKHSNFSSFVRQLNTYGFRKVDPDQYEFANEGFLRGQKQLMKSISRRKPAHVQSHPQQPQVCVEVGKFGLEEEVERLKRDKNVLMQELVRLRQQQQATDHQLQTVGQRVQVMEQRQQQMMSFLAKAMQSPGFLAQIVQQQNESNRLITGRNKKRRLPKQDEEHLDGENFTNSPDGKIVKFQPLMNEAAKAMLRQILKMNASPRLEPSMNNPDAFLIDDGPSSSNILDNESSSVTLLEVPPTSGQSYRPVGSGFHANYPTAAISDNRSSPPVVTDTAKAAQFSEANALNSRENTILPDFTQIQGIIPESTGKIPDVSYVGSESGNDSYLDRISAVLDGTISVETDVFSPEPDADILLDGIPKLPGINDAFWEQFFTASPPTGDTDEIDSSTMEGSVTMEQEFLPVQVNGWEKVQYMDNLTEQMGLLASENKTG